MRRHCRSCCVRYGHYGRRTAGWRHCTRDYGSHQCPRPVTQLSRSPSLSAAQAQVRASAAR
eukprot:768231-Hanusia_phi.AAC.3